MDRICAQLHRSGGSINIAFGLTAAKLSEISGYRVLLDPPIIAIHPMDVLATELGLFLTGEVASVHQVFTGPVSGDAILFLNYEGEGLDSSKSEILTEVGNMLLSACLGMFGNLLHVHVCFSVPRLQLNSIGQVLTSISIDGDELQYAVVTTASFNIREQGVEGRIAIVLGVSSLERLIQAVERWEGSQGE